MSAMTALAVPTDAQPRYTPEEFLALEDAVGFELGDDGHLEERGMGLESSWVGGRLHGRIDKHCEPGGVGWSFPADASYQCFADAPRRVRRPDVSFIAIGRLPGGRLPRGHCAVVPDFVAEVISPNDLAFKVEVKLQEYLRAGVRLVWILDSDTRTVRIHRADGSAAVAGVGHFLSGEDVIPGFRCKVDDLFPSPDVASIVPEIAEDD